MKTLIILLLICHLNLWGQTYNTSTSFITNNTSYISSTDITLINLSINYEYNSSKTYVPYYPYGNYGSVLSTLQGRFDRNWKILSQEYGKLLNLKLINKSNKEYLKKARPKIAAYIDAHSGPADFSRSDVFNSWLKYITQIANNPNVKNELLMLQQIKYAIAKLKNDYPHDFHKKSRYIELGKALEELRNASPSKIPDIAWKYGLQ